MRIVEVEQGTKEWHDLRLGKVTASRIADVMNKTKKGWGAQRTKYLMEKVAERLTGEEEFVFETAAMRWGTEKEPAARGLYSLQTGNKVREVGTVMHPDIDMALASPDGLIDDDGLVEIKCPLSRTHIQTLQIREPDEAYMYQMQWQMACTGRKWCDFVSFDPRMKWEQLEICILRIERDDDMIKELNSTVAEFLDEVQATIDALIKSNTETEAA